ncbi:MAG: RelA/SpoT domain-containing protein [Chloroflexi bacterium]|nr:RelA/SpoT domain-containing protein [Chloroflexota bacterium]
MKDAAEFEKDYQVLVPRAEQLCAEASKQLERLLRQAGIALANPIQSRVKTWASIAEKLTRVPLDLAKIEEMQDLAGMRLILLFDRDIETVRQIVRGHFDVVREYDTQDRLNPDQFGYSAIQLVVMLRPEWLAVPTMSSLEGLRVEIQLRTVAQHLWAEASQVLQYKNEATVPPSILRSVYRVSALLEIVDLELERVLAERERYVARLKAEENAPTRDQPLNVDLLAALLDRVFPEANKDPRHEPYADALEELRNFNLSSLDALERFLEANRAGAMEIEREFVAKNQRESLPDQDRRTRAGVFFGHVGLLRQALTAGLGKRYEDFQHEQAEARRAQGRRAVKP